MPQVTSANTNAASLMIGERGAEFVLQEQQKLFVEKERQSAELGEVNAIAN